MQSKLWDRGDDWVCSSYDVIHELDESSKRIRKNKFALKKSWEGTEMAFVSEDIRSAFGSKVT